MTLDLLCCIMFCCYTFCKTGPICVTVTKPMFFAIIIKTGKIKQKN